MSTQAARALPDLTGLDILRRFAIAPPSLIEARSLQRRVDRKYLLAASAITSLLARLQQSHCVVRANEHGWARYDSLYFDTPDRDLYHAHRCGRRPRYKVRIRHHVDRALSFLEVKRKDRSGRTTKHRLAEGLYSIEFASPKWRSETVRFRATAGAKVFVPLLAPPPSSREK